MSTETTTSCRIEKFSVLMDCNPVTSQGFMTDVEMNTDAGGLRVYLDSLADAIIAKVSVDRDRLSMVFEFEGTTREHLTRLLLRYYSTLLKHRIAFVRRENEGLLDLRHIPIAVTPFISCLFECIGVVEEPELGVSLTPIYKGSIEVFDSRQLRNASLVLGSLFQALGIIYATELSRDRRGDVEFMTMQVFRDEVCNETRRFHPVKALLASVLDLQQVKSVTLPRVSYGSSRILMRTLAKVVDYEYRN